MYMHYYGNINFNATTLPKFLSLLVDCALFAIIIIIIVLPCNIGKFLVQMSLSLSYSIVFAGK